MAADALGFAPFAFPRVAPLLDAKARARLGPEPALRDEAVLRQRVRRTREQAQALAAQRAALAARLAAQQDAQAGVFSSDSDFVVDADYPPFRTVTSRKALASRHAASLRARRAYLARRANAADGQVHVLSGIDYSNRMRNAVRIRRMKLYLKRLARRKAELTSGARPDTYGELGEVLRMEVKTYSKLGMLEQVFAQKYGLTYKQCLDGAYVAQQLVAMPPEPRMRKIRLDYTSTEEEDSTE